MAYPHGPAGVSRKAAVVIRGDESRAGGPLSWRTPQAPRRNHQEEPSEPAGRDALDWVGRELLGMENIALAVPETAAGIEGGVQ